MESARFVGRDRGPLLVHLLAAVSQRFGLLVRRQTLSAKPQETTALANLLAGLVLRGLEVTLDALFTQLHLAPIIFDPAERASLDRLLHVARQHWMVENGCSMWVI